MKTLMDGGIGTTRTIAEANLENALRGEGNHLYKPDWPTYLMITPENKVVLVQVEKLRKRLSMKKKKTLSLLQALGFDVEVIMEGTRERKHYTKKVGGVKLRPMKEPILKPKVEIFDPKKHMPTDEEIKEIDEIVKMEEKEYNDIFAKLKSTKELSEEDKKAYAEIQAENLRLREEGEKKAAEAAAKVKQEEEESKSQGDLTPEVRATRRALSNPQTQEQ